ncbi:zinc dependent phospholipase C family protein [Gracilibacillus oryzae]|uniref:Zinc dependent phospholipase C family protein n=1 Tax=Gracilibacillus oryzae TaxID=1672701 RepID=A0A7C8KTL8_9BACI|nr:zinc dependent phospholipase C family protein [Gracilibacillus oryzae]KAB8138144.1 zinc dependent phospholipase C family protein [Gracilibacillus oryzae]
MGSRMMHMIIGNKVAESLSIQDKTAFLLGSIAPDAVFTHDEKNLSHFFIGKVEDYTRSIDYKGFLQKYQSEEGNDYILGYCAHLIADDIWLRGFNLSWLRNRMAADEGLYKLYHNDFRLLNGKLLDYYNIKDEWKESLQPFSPVLDLEEVKSEDVERFVPYVLGDMDYPEDVVKEKLNVFTFDQIVGYIETSIEVAIVKLEPIVNI